MYWSDWPFLLSSALTQVTIGAFIVLAFVILSGKLCFGQSDRVHKTMPVFWLLLFVALTLREASLMVDQVYSVYTFGTEVLMVTVFFVLANVYWFAEKNLFGSDRFRSLLLIVALMSGLIYLTHGLIVRTNQWLVASHFIATTLCGGTLFAHTLLVRSEHKVEEVNRYLPIVGALIAVICLLTGLPQVGELAARVDSHNELGPFIAQVLSLGLLLAGVGVWLMPLLTRSKPVLGVMTFALTLMLFSSYLAAVGYTLV
ncbi:dimethyl sulfoxide reductase anchor subunit [Photobacterium frigidiphilum]|uniref:DmsC/YnfH family molybdoenzyme membrane anchor subunit n=1 Tax=Photobacterium frigidiphilum TaxID=264736 RepID=UPI003D128A20